MILARISLDLVERPRSGFAFRFGADHDPLRVSVMRSALILVAQASVQNYTVAITAYISEAVIIEDRCLGVFFDHLKEDDEYRIANGGIICTTKIQRIWKEGRFWILEAGEGNYLVGSFKRGGGRRSFLELLQSYERLKSED